MRRPHGSERSFALLKRQGHGVIPRKMAAAAGGTLTFGRFLGRSLRAARGLPVASRCFGVKISPSGEKITHTGQVYDEDDYRRIRFVARQKEVNENFAIDLIAEQPVSQVESRVISCDGGGGALGHPKVYINLDKETKTGTCGYCGLQFKQQHHH
ncbi:NADH dehydrogenase [ubiquinone] iron-sulfur protein 6, mitochondrial isoform X1 [Petaurus breviceps papuanus]|uniref:NADH dehydrogenase [ubiquinone] iron-sulfur protein 6, mitochondrial isoform X1 n=1 Tax=Petaurus breviceps papuanus TaxID=3040969 RepID=UPI0036D7D7C9